MRDKPDENDEVAIFTSTKILEGNHHIIFAALPAFGIDMGRSLRKQARLDIASLSPILPRLSVSVGAGRWARSQCFMNHHDMMAPNWEMQERRGPDEGGYSTCLAFKRARECHGEHYVDRRSEDKTFQYQKAA